MSLSARRAWIEIKVLSGYALTHTVALRKESVDRNTWSGGKNCLAEQVALRKESVDRNLAYNIVSASIRVSLSARRAWIEIVCGPIPAYPILRRSPQGERG